MPTPDELRDLQQQRDQAVAQNQPTDLLKTVYPPPTPLMPSFRAQVLKLVHTRIDDVQAKINQTKPGTSIEALIDLNIELRRLYKEIEKL